MQKIVRLIAAAAAAACLMLAGGASQAQRIGLGVERAQAARQAGTAREAEAARKARELEASLAAARNAPGMRRAPRFSNGPMWPDHVARAPGTRIEACYPWAPIGDGSYCGDPDSHWFFDGSHPSARGHRLIAGLFLLELAKAGELWRC